MSTMYGFHLPRVDILVATLTNLENFVRASDCIDWGFLKYLVIDAGWIDQNAALLNTESMFHPVQGH